MKNQDVNESLKFLNIDNKIIEKLYDQKIYTINDLWILKRKELKESGFTDSEVNHIRIKLQLCGLDLNKKMYL